MSHYCGIRDDEVFVGNRFDGIPSYLAHLPTIRLGDRALDIDGKKLPAIYRPMFIGRSDYDAYDRIIMARSASLRAAASKIGTDT